MIKQVAYLAPEAELLEIRFEDNFCGTTLNSTNERNKTEYYTVDEDGYNEL